MLIIDTNLYLFAKDLMNIFQATQGPEKLAKDLTLNTVMQTTSKYLSEGPIPVGEYKQASRAQPHERWLQS